MKLRKWLTSILAAGAMATAGSASAVIIGGIDFGATGTETHLETTTIAETLVNAAGQTLTGYGQVNTVNGADAGAAGYCAVDANCRLFFAFTYNTTTFAGATASFDSGSVIVYYDPGTGGADTGATRNLLDFSSPANLAYITGLTEWVELEGHAFLSTFCGVTELCAVSLIAGNVNVSFVGTGLLDVVVGGLGLADVQAFLNGNSEDDGLGGFADITFNSSGSSSTLNPNDTCTGQPGQWCIEGSADLRGKTVLVPEPGSMALLGLGLLGILGVGAVRRRRKI